jgi:succinate-semialdehyde dehydrogenase / glutarate-semialdehyde dehydrogenase
MSIQTINPVTNKIIMSFEEMTDEEVNAALNIAETAYQTWKTQTYAKRAAVLFEMAALLRLKKADLAKLVTLEMGKPIAQAEGEIALSADIFEYYAVHGEKFLADIILAPKLGEAYIKHSPIGVLFGVQPWNFPFYQVARFAAPNLIIGNTIVVKHASIVPQCGIAIHDLFIQAGADEGIYTNLLLSGKRASALVADKRIAGVSLTGSEEAGASLAMEAGKHLKKSVLELGGSDAFIVLEDADIDKAVEWGIIGRINNNGECCIASKRFIIVEEVYAEFMTKFTEKMKNLKVGDPMEPTTQLGPLSSEEAAKHIASQVNDAIKAGAKAILGGKRQNGEGAFMQPTILTEITKDNPVYYQELFGPVACLYQVKNEEEAIKLANDSPFGLGGSVFTNDIERGKRVAELIDTGMVFINHPTWTQADLPFGGTKGSGYGRELSELGVNEFVNKKLIRISGLNDPF